MADPRLSGMPDTFHVFSWPPANADIEVARNIDWPDSLLRPLQMLYFYQSNGFGAAVDLGEIGDFRGSGLVMVIWATLGASETARGANKPPNALSFMRRQDFNGR